MCAKSLRCENAWVSGTMGASPQCSKGTAWGVVREEMKQGQIMVYDHLAEEEDRILA